MVLQRAPSRANVWGWAKQSDIGSQVSVIIKNSATHYDNKVYISAVQAGKAISLFPYLQTVYLLHMLLLLCILFIYICDYVFIN